MSTHLEQLLATTNNQGGNQFNNCTFNFQSNNDLPSASYFREAFEKKEAEEEEYYCANELYGHGYCATSCYYCASQGANYDEHGMFWGVGFIGQLTLLLLAPISIPMGAFKWGTRELIIDEPLQLETPKQKDVELEYKEKEFKPVQLSNSTKSLTDLFAMSDELMDRNKPKEIEHKSELQKKFEQQIKRSA